jgi:hypothetical protein
LHSTPKVLDQMHKKNENILGPYELTLTKQ